MAARDLGRDRGKERLGVCGTMEQQKESKNMFWTRITAGLLALVFVLSMALTFRAQIRFSGLNYVGQVSEYAARVTEGSTGYLSRNTLDRAWAILRTTVRRPRTYEDFDLYASIAIAREDYETAIPYLRGCIDTYDGDDAGERAILWLRLASLYVLAEDHPAAMDALDRALEENGDLAPAWFLRAQLDLSRGETDAAVADLEVYRRLDTSDPVILSSLGALYEATGDYAAAEECYTAGITDERTYTVGLLADRARCRLQLGDRDGAENDLETYFSRDGDDPAGEAAALLGACRMEKQDYRGALAMFHRAVDDGYATPDVLYRQSVLCAYLCGEYARAAADGEKAIRGAEERGEETGELYFWVGLARMVMEQYEEASRRFTRAMEEDEDLPDLRYYLGVCALALEQPEEAAAYFTLSLEREESVTASLYDRGICYLQLERFEEAKADLLLVKERGDDAELTAQAEELLELL